VISRSVYSIYKLTASLLLFRSEGSISVQVTMWECPLHEILIVVSCPRLSTFIGRILRDDELLKCDRRSPYYRPPPVDNEYFYFCTLSFEAAGGHLNYCLFVRSNRVLPFTYVTSSSEHPQPPGHVYALSIFRPTFVFFRHYLFPLSSSDVVPSSCLPALRLKIHDLLSTVVFWESRPE
jgi:hypothetical protein